MQPVTVPYEDWKAECGFIEPYFEEVVVGWAVEEIVVDPDVDLLDFVHVHEMGNAVPVAVIPTKKVAIDPRPVYRSELRWRDAL
jgi:hypothetical protein